MTKLLVTARVVLYVAALLTPPVAVALRGMSAAEADRYEASARTANSMRVASTPPVLHDPEKPTAVVLMSNQGSQVTDVLAPFEVLSESQAFNVYAVAPQRAAVPLGGGLDVLPHLSLEELDRRLGLAHPDVIVAPAMPDVDSVEHVPVAAWLRKHAAGSRNVISVCNGARVIAQLGLLDGRRATANWAGIAGLAERYPGTEWLRGVRYVQDGNVVTAAGVTSGITATLHVLREYVGDEAAADLATRIGYPDRRLGDAPPIPASRLTAGDAALYVLGAAYGWNKPDIGIVLTEGMSEIELASVFDVYPGQAFTADTTTLTAEGSPQPVRSEHGLYFVPRSALGGAPSLDRALIPGRDAAATTDPSLRAWSRDRGLELQYVHATTTDDATATFRSTRPCRTSPPKRTCRWRGSPPRGSSTQPPDSTWAEAAGRSRSYFGHWPWDCSASPP